MKTQFKIDGNIYTVEIKAKDNRNLNASKKATETIINWFKARLNEARDNDSISFENFMETTYVLNSLNTIK